MSANIQRTDLYSVSFLSKKIYGAPMKPYELICFKDKKFRDVIIFLSSMQ